MKSELSQDEYESKMVASLIRYVNEKRDIMTAKWVVTISKSSNGNVAELERLRSMLNDRITALTPEDRIKIVNANNSVANLLRTWLDMADKKKSPLYKKQKLRESGLAKLTKDEREALGL